MYVRIRSGLAAMETQAWTEASAFEQRRKVPFTTEAGYICGEVQQDSAAWLPLAHPPCLLERRVVMTRPGLDLPPASPLQ